MKDASTGTLIRRFLAFGASWSAVGLVGLPDFSGNGADEVAVAAQRETDDRVLVRIFDAASGARLGELPYSSLYRPEGLAALPSFGGTSAHEIALLGVHSTTGKVLVRIKDASSGGKLSDVYFPTTYEPVRMIVVPSFDGTPADEIALLGTHSSTDRVLVRVKDASSGSKLDDLFFSKAYRPRDMILVPGFGGTAADELAVLGVDTASRVLVRVKDASSGAKLKDVFFSKAYAPASCVGIASFGGTAAAEIAVAGLHDTTDRVLLRSKDASSGSKLSQVGYSKDYPPEAVVTVPDFGDSAADEVALLGRHTTHGDILVRVKDAQTGSLLATIPIP